MTDGMNIIRYIYYRVILIYQVILKSRSKIFKYKRGNVVAVYSLYQDNLNYFYKINESYHNLLNAAKIFSLSGIVNNVLMRS